MYSEALIKETQSTTINLCNHNESQVLGAANDIIPSPLNNSLGGFLPQKLIMDVLKVLECR